MCGIAGVANVNEHLGPTDRAAVERISQAQLHRGPDAGGLHQDNSAVLGHRRLSIIDLSEAGSQPMSNETGNVWTVYNGEIYNYTELRRELTGAGHRFRSQSDTEVLIHGYEEWGEEGLLAKLRGMFAFAIYDSSRQRLVLGRDRLGIKPLYYVSDARTGRIGFASEVKALVKAGLSTGEADRIALAGFLLLGSIPAPRTIVRDVQCLMPGHYLVADAQGVRAKCYWDLSFASHEVEVGDGESPDRLANVLRDSIKRHLMSDVPLGVFLSGGVDSAGLVALTRQMNRPVKTLNISFAEAEFNEGSEARRIAEHFETEHHEIRVCDTDFVHALPKILSAMDQPTNDGVNTYFVARAAREAGLTVVLSGLGGDELFRGYPHYHWMARNSRPLAMFAGAPNLLRRACVDGFVALGRMRGKESWMRLSALRPRFGAEGMYLALRGFFADEQMRSLLGSTEAEMNSAMSETLDGLRPATNGAGENACSTNDLNYIEIKRYLHDQLLRDTDVFSMAHSIEVRVPYLDDEVVGLAASLPGASKLREAMNKPLLVDAIGDAYVAELSRRSKRGFSFPLSKWMSGRSGAMREMALSTKLLEPEAVGKLWSAFEQGRLHWSRAWSLVVLGGALGDPA